MERSATSGPAAGTHGATRGRAITVLGIESSCDDTAVAVVRLSDATNDDRLSDATNDDRLAGAVGDDRVAAARGGDRVAGRLRTRPAWRAPWAMTGWRLPGGATAWRTPSDATAWRTPRGVAVAAGRGPDGAGGSARPRPEILSSVVASQDALHAAFGGVVPEIAARAHAERLDAVTEGRAGPRPGWRSGASTRWR